MVKIVGHRGFRAEEPENTLRSFKSAIKAGVDAIEFDLRQTKDKKIIIFHDEIVDKKTDGKGKVKDLTSDQIKKLNVVKDSKKDKILEFEEALKFFKNRKIEIFVELKEIGFEKKVLDLLGKYNLKNKSIIISFLKQALKNLKKYDKKIRTGIIYIIPKNRIELANKIKINFLISNAAFLYKPFIKKAHQNNLKILVWTLNKKQTIKKFASYNVDYIATDNPKIAKSVINF